MNVDQARGGVQPQVKCGARCHSGDSCLQSAVHSGKPNMFPGIGLVALALTAET